MNGRGYPIIVCAANKLSDGRLLIGARHWDDHMQKQMYDKTHNDLDIELNLIQCEQQGFVDQFGKFYNRKDAWILAEKNGQIRFTGPGYSGPDLYSENLY